MPPVQRGSGEPTTDFLALIQAFQAPINETLREVKDGLTRLSEQIALMPDKYVSQSQFASLKDDMVLGLGEERATRKSEIIRLVDALERAVDRADEGRRLRITLLASTALALLGSLVSIVLHFLH